MPRTLPPGSGCLPISRRPCGRNHPRRFSPATSCLSPRRGRQRSAASREIRLTDADLNELCASTNLDETATAPHVEMGVRVYAPTLQAVDRGEFTVSVRPAWSTGTLTGRFAATLRNSGLADAYKGLPTLVDGALSAQLSFTPAYPHAENVAAPPPTCPTTSPSTSTAPRPRPRPGRSRRTLHQHRLYLVSLPQRRSSSRTSFTPSPCRSSLRRSSGSSPTSPAGSRPWTQLDGDRAAAMPYLPRLRYRNAISPPPGGSHRRRPARRVPPARWHEALADWARSGGARSSGAARRRSDPAGRPGRALARAAAASRSPRRAGTRLDRARARDRSAPHLHPAAPASPRRDDGPGRHQPDAAEPRRRAAALGAGQTVHPPDRHGPDPHPPPARPPR